MSWATGINCWTEKIYDRSLVQWIWGYLLGPMSFPSSIKMTFLGFFWATHDSAPKCDIRKQPPSTSFHQPLVTTNHGDANASTTAQAQSRRRSSARPLPGVVAAGLRSFSIFGWWWRKSFRENQTSVYNCIIEVCIYSGTLHWYIYMYICMYIYI